MVAGVRSEAAAQDLEEHGPAGLMPVTLDVTDAGSIDAAYQATAETTERGLAGIVNNAGVALAAPLEFVPLGQFRRQLEVNLVGPLAVTQRFLPLVRAAGGRVINIGSIGGRISHPFMGPYGASKFGLEALTDALRQELRPWGIHVAIIEPGSVATPIWAKGSAASEVLLEELPAAARELYASRMSAMRSFAERVGRRGMPPRAVARVVAEALTAPRPRTRYLVGGDARAQIALATLLPDRLFDRLTDTLARALGRPIER